MDVYFVRHGQSVANAAGRRQGPTGPLSDLGRQQADFLGKRLSSTPLDFMVVSPYERTRETAEIINGHLGLEQVESDLFIERKIPSALVGQQEGDPAVAEAFAEILRNYGDPGWRHSDEETFWDLRDRAMASLQYLEGLGKQRILVVTHGMFMRMIMACILHGDRLTPAAFLDVWRTFVIKNTGITLCRRVDNEFLGEEGKVWKLVAWNDHAHLV